MTQGSTTWTSIRGQEIPMMGEKLLKYDLNIVDLYELKWSELKWSEVKWIELNWIVNWIAYGIMYMWLAIVCQQTDTDDSIAYAAIGIEIHNLMDVLR